MADEPRELLPKVPPRGEFIIEAAAPPPQPAEAAPESLPPLRRQPVTSSPNQRRRSPELPPAEPYPSAPQEPRTFERVAWRAGPAAEPAPSFASERVEAEPARRAPPASPARRPRRRGLLLGGLVAAGAVGAVLGIVSRPQLVTDQPAMQPAPAPARAEADPRMEVLVRET
ncbi:MAG: hypothetical protein ABW042_05205, partial [Phenylobacterium sp.]